MHIYNYRRTNEHIRTSRQIQLRVLLGFEYLRIAELIKEKFHGI